MRSRRSPQDSGSVLPMVLVVSLVLSLVVIALATYAISTLRYGQVVETRTDTLAAAEGGMRDVLSRLDDDGNLCTTGAGIGGIVIPFPQIINESTVEVRCQAVGASLSTVTSWAVMVTGEGGTPVEEGLWTQSGAGITKVFGGPTYVANPNLVRLQAPLEIREGNLWYTDGTCPEGGEYISDGSSIGSLSFDPPTRGLWCTEKLWTELFFEPDLPNLGALPPLANASILTNPTDYSYQDFGSCRVFRPGRYTFEPDWATYNYMQSGDYYFDLGTNESTATVDITHATVTAGKQGVAGDQQVISNTACDAQRELDAPGGATFFLDRATSFEIGVQGALEILRREQGSAPVDYVSIQTLPTSTLTYISPAAVSTASGGNKQMAIHGQIWAPQARVVFGEVSNTAVAQLLGGAVVGALKADASASASGFAIQVQGSPQSDKYRLTATASKGGQSTSVRVIAQLRYSIPTTGGGVGNWEVAMNSWRVCQSSVC